MNPTLATAKNPVAAIDQPDNFAVWVNGVWGNAAEWTLETASALGDKQRGSARCRDQAGRRRRLRGRDRAPDVEALVESRPERAEPDEPNPGAVYGSSVTYPAARR